jgi:tetratricopeptide (TPR) repeat protein
LQHPAIPPVVDRGTQSDGLPFFSLKLIHGQTLESLLDARANPADDLPKFVGIFEQICQAVGYAHSRGVIHRDLKPSNVMVGAFGEVQVMDWGMAKELGAAEEPASASVKDLDIASAEIAPDGTLTIDGQVMGTLPYMPPEQANGRIDDIDARADVFALGGILCKILTGNAPYKAQPTTALYEEVRRARLADAFERLGNCQADEELVDLCRHCLAVVLDERPDDGAAVAEEVSRYQEAVQQRLEAEKTERAAAEVRIAEERKRRRITLVLVATASLLVMGIAAAAWWYQQDSVARDIEAAADSRNAEREIHAMLGRAAELRDGYDFKTATALLSQAEARLKFLLEPADLRAQIAQANRDLVIVEKLDAIRLRKSTLDPDRGRLNLTFGNGKDGPYAGAFRAYGIDIPGDKSAEHVGARIEKSAVKEALLAAFDDWAKDETDRRLRDRVLSVARAADADPLRRRLRDPAVWGDRQALVELARQAEGASLAPATLASLALRLSTLGESNRAVALLKSSTLKHSKDFFLQIELANVLGTEPIARRDEAIGYSRAAIATRPDNAAAFFNLGTLLKDANRPKEAEAAFRRAIEIDPRFAPAHSNFGVLLAKTNRHKEAEAAFRRAIELDPKYAPDH